MAGGALVPHTLPDGRTIMVPDYLAGQPGGGALAMPNVPAPMAGPDMRVAGPGGGMADPSAADPMEAAARMQSLQPSAQEQQVSAIRSALVPKVAPGANEHKSAPNGPGWMPRGEAKGGGGGSVDPSTLAEPGGGKAAAPSGERSEGEWNPLVRQVFNEGGRGGGGGPRRTGRREETSVTAERTPGKELLPELRWAMGLEGRPQELDPDAAFVADDPQYRPVETGVTLGAKRAGESAKLAYEQQVNQEQQRLNAEREVLAQQSQALDANLAQVAERRNRIAKLQETADQRMEEAKSFEPRTRDQVWQEKGPAAQVMGILAMALGGYVQGSGRGSRNPGLDIVNQVINDAIEGDRYKAEKRMKVGAAAKSDYEKALALYGDPEAAMLEAKNRKLASTMGMLQNQLASRGLDEQAKMRGEQLYAAAEQQYLQNAQQLYDQLNGVVVKESINYKPEMVGGGGGGLTLSQRLKRAADATQNINIIEGKGDKPFQRSVEGDKLGDINGAMEAIDAADAVTRDLRVLGASSDIDDPLSGPVDALAKVVGTGGTGRRTRQSLEANTARLARGIQQSLGKSDNDAKLADQMATGDGSAASRAAAAKTAREQAMGRLQSAMAGMTPQQRQSFLEGLPPERRAMVQEAATAVGRTPRAKTERVVE